VGGEHGAAPRAPADFYTPLAAARGLIQNRWADASLRQAVEDTLPGDVAAILRERPHGVLWRQVGTPDGEFEQFLSQCASADLRPLCLTYVEDRFHSGNYIKYALTRLAFKTAVDRHGRTVVTRHRIIEFNGAEGKRLDDLRTLWGERLPEFHHAALWEVFPVMRGAVTDLSQWLRRKGTTAAEHYEAILSLALCHIVLFEDFDELESEARFFNDVVLPAQERVRRAFGIAPVIARISPPGSDARDPYWGAYGAQAQGALLTRMRPVAALSAPVVAPETTVRD